MKGLVLAALLSTAATSAYGNDLFVNQIGDDLTLTVTQSGTGNTIGDAVTALTLNGNDMTFTIEQQGDNNVISAIINGNTYTGEWQFIGNNNTVDLTCDSLGQAQCEVVTVDIFTTGSDNTYNVYIGEAKIADNLLVSFDVSGDGNIINANLDAANADVTIIIDNAGGLGNTFNIDQDDAGSVNGHSLAVDHTGGNSTFNIIQSGLVDKIINVVSFGDNQVVNITQTD